MDTFNHIINHIVNHTVNQGQSYIGNHRYVSIEIDIIIEIHVVS